MSDRKKITGNRKTEEGKKERQEAGGKRKGKRTMGGSISEKKKGRWKLKENNRKEKTVRGGKSVKKESEELEERRSKGDGNI